MPSFQGGDPSLPTPAPLGRAGSQPQPMDGPPPSPALAPTGPQGMRGLAPPLPIPSAQLPPEILAGVMQVADRITTDFQSLAQALPDLSPEFLMIQELLQQALGKILQAGGTPPSATATGPSFPGGGFAQGGRP
jgi:hypothetical protein